MPFAEQSINVSATPEKIWEMVKEPSGWPQWFEGASTPKVLSGNGDAGTEVEVTMSVAKIEIPTRLKITETVPGERWRGDFHSPGVTTGFMEWRYLNMGTRTKLTFRIEAELQGAAKIAEGRVVKGFEELAEKTLHNLKSMVES
ncbi:MAG TPA: SRPBCC family protein [Anaerolineae bacterium]|nr:SRPBCC family protein [Anaerolineae bacterium]HQI86960.1 SRPBCC family protein [Anaerolineae bacterium]